MEFLLKRRWPRFECKKSVNAKIFWAHRLMPFVSVKLMDVSKKKGLVLQVNVNYKKAVVNLEFVHFLQ